jgi:CheY-like chemotaxis protein
MHSSSNSRLVLVVDDVLTNTKMLVRLLERAGHECITAKNGKEAIDAYAAHQVALGSAAKSRPIDTVLMDFEMPGMNGPDATRRMREMGCGAYIFGVTGNVLIEDVTTFKESGADLVMFKPINLNAIDEAWEKMENCRPHILEPGKDCKLNGRLKNCLAVNRTGIRHRHDKEGDALATTLPLVCTHDRTNGGHTRITHTD